MKENIDILNRNLCTGCRMCEQICPVQAIKMIENEEGFIEPQIDNEKCIKCGLCAKKCPQLNTVDIEDKLDKQIVYAAKNKNVQEQKNSSSGGIFSVLSNYVIENNGFVYGASFDENLKLSHIRIDNKEDLYKLRGSKYLQSNTKITFTQVKKDLEKDSMVLYVGTPCQIAGLRNYLGKDYEKLILVDLVCHGVPSQKLFDKYIKWLEKKNKSKILNYQFRNKEKTYWELGYKPKVIFENKVKFTNGDTDIYVNSFLKGYTLREVCYSCKYTNINRIGDITLGDFWGIGHEYPKLYDKNGVSIIIVNTQKGKNILNKVIKQIKIGEVDINKVLKHAQPLLQPAKRDTFRDNLIEIIDENNIGKILGKRINVSKKIKKYIPLKIRAKLKRLNYK